MNDDPVIHHVEMCVQGLKKNADRVKKYGFRPFLKRSIPGYCEQMVMKLNKVFFIITEKDPNFKSLHCKDSLQSNDLTVLCPSCYDQISYDDDHVDTLFNVCLHVKDVQACVSRITQKESSALIKPPTTIEDSNGYITYAIVKSICGNVIHTLINKEHYQGYFLPGFYEQVTSMEDVEESLEVHAINKDITHIDHVTLATYSGKSQSIINFYESCFGMKRVSISSSQEDTEEGLILKEGVGLRLKAMEYWMCAETGLTNPSTRSMMLVVVESLPGQTNCNVETFLRQHRGPGVEHVALSTKNIVHSVQSMKQLTVTFRTPPATYYKNLRQTPEINEIDGLNMSQLEKLGILIDREIDEEEEIKNLKPKYLMQIFALPIFDRKTLFIEIIQRAGAKGLGAGNILALVRSIREEEKRKALEEKERERNNIANEPTPSVRTF